MRGRFANLSKHMHNTQRIPLWYRTSSSSAGFQIILLQGYARFLCSQPMTGVLLCFRVSDTLFSWRTTLQQ